MMNYKRLAEGLRRTVIRLEERQEAKDKELEETQNQSDVWKNLTMEKSKELKAKQTVIDELRSLDINSLLGEAVLDVMLINPTLGVRLDCTRGRIKRLLADKE